MFILNELLSADTSLNLKDNLYHPSAPDTGIAEYTVGVRPPVNAKGVTSNVLKLKVIPLDAVEYPLKVAITSNKVAVPFLQ